MSAPPRAAVVVVGDEILSGAVEDHNGPYLLRALAARGVAAVELRQVADQVAAIAAASRALAAVAEQVIVCGGVGPTHDDVTMAGIGEAVGEPLVVAEELLRFYAGPDAAAASPAHRKMAAIPRGARAHLAAPGRPPFVPVIEVGALFVLPGVPALMRDAFEGVEVWGRGPAFVVREVALACRESDVAEMLAAVQAAFADVQIGSYPQGAGRPGAGGPRLKITCRGRVAARVEAARTALARQLPLAYQLGAG